MKQLHTYTPCSDTLAPTHTHTHTHTRCYTTPADSLPLAPPIN